jgi:hypothetical protein
VIFAIILDQPFGLSKMTRIIPHPSAISAVENRLLSEAWAIEQEEAANAGMLGYMARVFVQATLPHSAKAGCEYKRSNGAMSVSLLSPSNIGLPYGSYPRLLLCWLTTEAVKTKSRKLTLGHSLCEFMSTLGLMSTGGRWGTVSRFKDQMVRLFSSSMHVILQEEWPTGFDVQAMRNFMVADEATLYWSNKNPIQPALWNSEVILGEVFYKHAVHRPVPLDMRAIKALRKSPLALDLYAWATHRVSYLKKPTLIPWTALVGQFGGDYAPTKQGRYKFKEKVLGAFKKIEIVYPSLRISCSPKGLLVKPSATHVARPGKEKLSPKRV